MARQKRTSKIKPLHLVTGGVALLIIVAVALVAIFFPHGGDGSRKKQMQTVTIVTPPPPPPPPKVVEKPPEPIKEQEKIETPKEELPTEKPEPIAKEPPTSSNLGLDANAGVGSDAFGLQAKRGGASIIGGSGGNGGSLYGWYANQLSTSLQKTANEILQQEGGIPPGKWDKVSFEVSVDVFGKISKFTILKSSGNPKIDEAVKKALQMAHTFEPPPPGMPKVLRFAVLLQG